MIETNHIQTWEEAQTWEIQWHQNQQFNTYNEETKQYIYSVLMGLDEFKTNYYGIVGWDFGDRKVIDIGGGEVSMLLKSKAKFKMVIDPLKQSNWSKMRYIESGIEFFNMKGEDIKFELQFDIGLIYNCLQHTEDPEKIVANMKRLCKEVRVFEWINEGISDGHIHNLTEEKLNEWFGGVGKTGYLNQRPCVGNYYAGIFKGDLYE